MSRVAKVFAVVWEAIVMIVSFVVELVHAVVGPLGALVGAPLELLLAVPVVGRLSRQAMNVGQEIVWRVAGLPDVLFDALGIRPEKKLRLQVVILRDEAGQQVATPARVLQDVKAAIDVYMDQAQIRILPVGWVRLSTPFSRREDADERFVRTASKSSGKSMLDIECTGASWLNDLGTRGTDLQLKMSWLGLWGNLRRLLGYGSPVTVFVVRDIKNALGCSLGPLTDYLSVTLVAGDDTTTFHELGHSCGLWDGGQAGTVMSCAGPCATKMSTLQRLIVRNSRHVTYF